jgi:hypothetical protein
MSMRLWLLPCSALLAECSGAYSGDSSEDEAKWQGAWKLVSCAYNGGPEMADMRVVSDG